MVKSGVTSGLKYVVKTLTATSGNVSIDLPQVHAFAIAINGTVTFL